ncbi:MULTISPECIES: peroxidase-related enzyme [Mycolicibacterium]|uniref:Peroxidase-related enzyme n=1 Tax=Mycolicibacterium austroafricanum TaxID=39687 RepID=A0ABT8HE87_MYCAO|nr:peroxidase-related enzyme [Mycolicibacterium austroafricanum]MDN4518840.1 peroxidase-related enzyme [Mycolicibacterium austroafricanum]PQP46152.1 peroxidase [Mycolicibacterium austroafricanum]QRZ09569.1 peroxidase-related enzyme [Mycolicibacterium austroafricanum]QZT65982.1 peroxidase-related enzyme [Mycolicibacterium austroafricanum]QZY43733.1 peroxidase-related enzyme [Mycolicibacterium austroafricanum]
MTATADAPVQARATISRLAVPELDELRSPGVRGFFNRQLRDEGLTSNWFRALSLNEGDLERLNAYLLPLLGTDGRGGLSAREREVIATVVSGENRCAYCHTNHANKLGKVAGDWSFGQRVAIDHQVAELTERERALADLAVAVNSDPQSIRDSDIVRLRDLGLDDHEILEGISIAAFIGATNRIGIALSVPPNPEYTGIPAGRGHTTA